MKIMKQLSGMLRLARNSKYMLMATGAMLLGACIDTSVLPVDKTIGEDYWKSRDDVSLMVNGAYKAMTSSDIINRMMVWGELRGDNVNPNSDLQSSANLSALEQVNTLNLDDKNTYADWSAFYAVINKCNIVLDQAENVTLIDPTYTKGLYQIDRSQMLALRALAYFYLVRAYRDVPYTSGSYQNSSQTLAAGQMAPDEVLTHCINDLEEAETMALSPTSYSDWRRYGFVNRDGIRAILADIYLWRASMNASNDSLLARNRSDYQRCADLCQQIIQSKAQTVQNTMTAQEKLRRIFSEEYGLLKGEKVFSEVFVSGNSIESILELQFDGTNAVNTAVCQNYWQWKAKTTPGFMEAVQAFGVPETDKKAVSTSNVYASDLDYRFWANCFKVNSATAEKFDVRKMVSVISGDTERKAQTSTGRNNEDYSSYNQNWILYRLTDVMLMRAEALVQLADATATTDNNSDLQNAYTMVKTVYRRSLASDADTLNPADYKSRDVLEELVLSERRRELCFEGKRWFDLMRYAYRHMTGVDATQTMGNQHNKTLKDSEGNAIADVTLFPAVSSDMINMVRAKYTDGGATLAFQLTTEPKLYFPILNSELKVNSLLVQNPGYRTSSGYQKNY